MTFLDTLAPIFSPRFLKFCSVGASGVFVNLGFLYLFAECLGIQTNLASALAIEVSILSNFLINELWTFRDRREENTLSGRIGRFHLVSLVGGAMQWVIFVLGNYLWFRLGWGGSTGGGEAADPGVTALITNPPEVGWLKYVSQLLGIGVATFWNFLLNFHWTWKRKRD